MCQDTELPCLWFPIPQNVSLRKSAITWRDDIASTVVAQTENLHGIHISLLPPFKVTLAMMGVDTLRNVKSKLCDSSFSLDKTFFHSPSRCYKKMYIALLTYFAKQPFECGHVMNLQIISPKIMALRRKQIWPSRHCIQSLLTVLACMWRLVRWHHLAARLKRINPLESTRVHECLKLHLHKCKAMLGLSFEKPEALGFSLSLLRFLEWSLIRSIKHAAVGAFLANIAPSAPAERTWDHQVTTVIRWLLRFVLVVFLAWLGASKQNGGSMMLNRLLNFATRVVYSIA